MEERGGGGDNDTVLAELLDSALDGLDGALQVGLPDVSSVDDTSGQDGLGAESTENGVELLGVADKVNVDGIDVLGEEVKVVDDVTEVGGEDQLGDLVAEAGELLIGGLESSLGLGREIEDEDGLVDLDSLSASLLELDEELLVDRQKAVEQVDGVDGLATVGLSEVQEAHRADQDGAGSDASLLGLVELNNGLGGGGQLEGLAILESRLDVVVVGVEPLDHLQTGDIDASLLVATAHGEVLVNSVKAILGVALRNSLSIHSQHWSGVSCLGKRGRFVTYTKVLDVRENLVVQGEVVAGDDVDAGILLDLPVSETKSLGLSKKLSLRDLSTPVCTCQC